jgi:hypothetical protein
MVLPVYQVIPVTLKIGRGKEAGGGTWLTLRPNWLPNLTVAQKASATWYSHNSALTYMKVGCHNTHVKVERVHAWCFGPSLGSKLKHGLCQAGIANSLVSKDSAPQSMTLLCYKESRGDMHLARALRLTDAKMEPVDPIV